MTGPSRTSVPARLAPLTMSADAFRVLGHALVDQVADLLDAVPHGPVTRDLSPPAVRDALGASDALPEEGEEAGPLLERTVRLLAGHSLFNGHPRFFGYITSSPAPIGVLGELLAAAVNANVGAWALSPAASEIELQTIRWLATFIRYDPNCGGILVSGGNMANMVCLLAARAGKTPWDARAQGTSASGRSLRLYCSTETHTWIQKAADISGLGTASIRWIPTDRARRMDVTALSRQVDADRAAGDVPFLVVGSAGTVSTGAIDPLRDIAALCAERDLWFHVDGAYGGFANALADAPDDLRGVSLADSVAVDPHKWLYAPLEVGCALVKDPAALPAAFSYHPPYYHFGEQVTNFFDYGPQNSRGFRALKVWLALRQVGASGYRTMIADDIALSRALAVAIEAHPELELADTNLSITTFRYVPAWLRSQIGTPAAELTLSQVNRALLDVLQREGQAFVSQAVCEERFLLRACIVNFHTSRHDVDALPEIVARVGRRVSAAAPL